MGEFGIFGNFGQGEPYAEEDAKRWYEPNKKWLWRLIWELMPVNNLQEFTDLILSLQNLFCINFIKTSYQKLVI